MPVVVVASFTVKPESVDAVREACKKAVAEVHNEPGCDLYAVHEGDKTFVFVEQWADEDALKTHSTAPGVTALFGAIGDTSTAPRHQDAHPRSGRRPGQGPSSSLIVMGELDGKVALITGAARGQGRAHAVKLASEGASIIAVDLCDQIASVPPYPDGHAGGHGGHRQTRRGHRRADRRPRSDVRDRTALKNAMYQGIEELGRLDIVIANAGIAPMADDAPGRTSSTSTSPASITPSTWR